MKPSHYSQYELDALDIAKAMGDLPAFCRTNVIKYVMRYQHKPSAEVGLQDLHKAKHYLELLIETQEDLLNVQ